MKCCTADEKNRHSYTYLYIASKNGCVARIIPSDDGTMDLLKAELMNNCFKAPTINWLYLIS